MAKIRLLSFILVLFLALISKFSYASILAAEVSRDETSIDNALRAHVKAREVAKREVSSLNAAEAFKDDERFDQAQRDYIKEAMDIAMSDMSFLNALNAALNEIALEESNTNNHLSARLSDPWDDKEIPTSPSDAWAKRNQWPYGWWKKNSNNTQKAAEFFNNWVANYDTTDTQKCKENKLSVMKCFAYAHWGDIDFDCTIDAPHRCQTPSFNDVAQYIDNHWTKYSPGQKAELARNVMFTIQTFQGVLGRTASTWGIMNNALPEINFMMEEIVTTFTAPRDKMQMRKCEMAKMAIKLVMDLVLESANIAGTFVSGPVIGKILKAAQKAAQGVADITGEAVQKTFLEINQHKEWMQLAAKLPASTAKLISANTQLGVKARKQLLNLINNANDKSNSGGRGSMPGLELHITKAKGLCGNQYSIPEDDKASFIRKASIFVKKSLGESQQTLNQNYFRAFTEYQEDGSIPDNLIYMMKMEFLQDGNIQNEYQVTKDKFNKSFKNGLISKLSAGSRCFVACEQRDDAPQLCAADAYNAADVDFEPSLTQLSRYCPEDRPDVRCQQACWPKQESHWRQKYVYGIDGGFQEHGIHPQDLMRSSWAHYRDFGTQDSLISHNVVEDGTIEEADKMLHIPVCLSKVETIEDISSRKRRSKFPYSCGSFTNEESADFLQAINVHFKSEHELVQKSLAKHLKSIPEPLNQFSLLCRDNVRWPWHTHSERPTNSSRADIIGLLVPESKDPNCDEILDAFTGMENEIEANRFFCNMPVVINNVFGKEMHMLVNGVRRTKNKCRSFMEKNGFEWNVKSDPEDEVEEAQDADEDKEDVDEN